MSVGRETQGSECLYFRTKEKLTLSEKAVSPEEGVKTVKGKLAEVAALFILFDVRTLRMQKAPVPAAAHA